MEDRRYDHAMQLVTVSLDPPNQPTPFLIKKKKKSAICKTLANWRFCACLKINFRKFQRIYPVFFFIPP